MQHRKENILTDKIIIRVNDTEGYEYHPDIRWGEISGKILDQGDLIDYFNRKVVESLSNGTITLDNLITTGELNDAKKELRNELEINVIKASEYDGEDNTFLFVEEE